jgi:hypothetical protein
MILWVRRMEKPLMGIPDGSCIRPGADRGSNAKAMTRF